MRYLFVVIIILLIIGLWLFKSEHLHTTEYGGHSHHNIPTDLPNFDRARTIYGMTL